MPDPRETAALRLDVGAELPAAAEAAAADLGFAFCEVTGFGELEWIEISRAGAPKPERIEGPLHLLDLKGRIRRAGDLALSDFLCTVAAGGDIGTRLESGRLVRAAVGFVELSLTPLVAAGTGARQEAAAPRPDPAEEFPPRPEASPKPASPLSERWSEAIAESLRQERIARKRGWDDEDGEIEQRPERGDVVHHRQFGRCRVIKVDDDHISLRKGDGRVVQLGLAVLRFSRRGAVGEDGRSEYDVEVARTT